jgi:uncharacterized protein YoxC
MMNGKKIVGRRVAIVLGIICILLTVSLVGAIANYTSIIRAKDNTIASKDSTINNLNSEINGKNSQIQTLTSQNNQLQTWLDGNVTTLNSHIAGLQDQLASANSQIASLNSQIATLQSQVNDLTAIINMSKSKLETLVFHVCEKGEGYTWGRTPDVNYTYNQILTLNKNMYDVLLLPEYKGNENWTETLAWLTGNFSGIPIMLSAFEGGPYDYPVVKLTTDQISEAMAACDVRWLRISEVVSWYIEHNLPFPTDYVTNILNFCKEHNLKVQWNEWKVGDNAFQRIQSYIGGFEGIVTVTFSTNSGDLEPAEGFILMNNLFQHWGGSVQAWYWETRHRGNYTTVPENPPGLSNPLNMPISLLIQHALSAKNIGAEILQFEPYWYFFDNGEAKESLRLLEIMLS